ncbi:MAG: DUF1552 domain-containing protein [Alphaproteobacteria bacterium]|nr:DUF1552 domain-containing protein [Alphaproteobacteria bacterium]MCB9692975.1 DUF1552 domain-containing protein [Alphaproteobacteria bacterium]
MISRRRFLAGLGGGAGAALLGPFLRQAFATLPTPARFVFVVEGNCIEPVCFMSTGARTAIDAAATGSTVGRRWFPTLYGHASALVDTTGDLGTARALDPLLGGPGLSDLTSHAAVVLGLSSTITGGGHSTHFGALSCSRSRPSRAAGQTIDAYLATLPDVRGQTPFDAVRVGVDSSGARLANVTCAFDVGRSAPVTLDPRLAYDNLFGFLPGSSGATSFARRSDLLDFAHADVTAALATFPGNSAERAKLEQYLASLETVRQRQIDLAAVAAAIDPLDPTTAFASPEDPSTNPLYATGAHLDVLHAQFDNVAAALVGGLTNVAVITSGTGDSGFGRMVYGSVLQGYPALDNALERHDLHHLSSGSQPHIDAIHDVSREHVRRIADLARTLEATPEIGGGTMLDHTVIVYLPDNGEQHHSTASEWPVLLVGGQGLGLHTDGRTVVYPGVDRTNNRQLSNLFNTLAHAAGNPLDTFGQEGQTRIAPGPLSELL